MTKIFDIREEREAREPHLSGKARCLACGCEWIAVAPVGVVDLECPDCHLLRGVFTGNAQENAEHWNCVCGNDLFHITKDNIYCPKCGLSQRGFE